MLAIKTILYATDFSERAELAFRLACSLARDYGARLIVLHVVEQPVLSAGQRVLIPEFDLRPLRERLQPLRPDDPKISVEHRLVEGRAAPATEILRVAEELNVDLIVAGTHGRTGLGRLLMGSVAEELVRNASCPVLTVKSP
jgi:nucleotide-binding universal stress UspA family protein